jgi:hypothetical protein
LMALGARANQLWSRDNRKSTAIQPLQKLKRGWQFG